MRKGYRDGVLFRLTMSLTPTLWAMLNDELLRERYLRAYFSGLENYLEEPELRWFSMDAHGLMFDYSESQAIALGSFDARTEVTANQTFSMQIAQKPT